MCLGSIPSFHWKQFGIPKKKAFVITADVPAKIQTEHLPNASLDLYLQNNLQKCKYVNCK
jgi:hypothetical protein